MENNKSSDDVIVEQDGDQPELLEGQPSGDVNAELETPQPQKDPDDYYKNKAFELERKYSNTEAELKEIKRLLQEKQSSNSSENQYSEEQLRAALSSEELSTQQRVFAEQELRKIQDRKLEERDKKLIDQIERKNRENLTRQQAEAQVISDPRFQEAFIKLPNGTVRWKEDSKLAQMIGSYMQDPRLGNQPDAIAIASKLAYADMMAISTQKDLQTTKRQNEQLKSQTMIEGGGKKYNKPSVDPYQENLQRLKSGDKYASTSTVKEYLRKRGAFNK